LSASGFPCQHRRLYQAELAHDLQPAEDLPLLDDPAVPRTTLMIQLKSMSLPVAGGGCSVASIED